MNPEPSNPPGSLLPVPPAADFSNAQLREKLRAELRAEEWAMHKELMTAARIGLKNFYENPHKSSVADIGRILDLSSKLGRLATESNSGFDTNTDTAILMIPFHDALKKVYARRHAEGKPLPPDAIIEAEVITPPSTTNPPPA